MLREWIYEPYLSDHDNLIFYNALYKHRDPFYYHPIALARREETGMKYHFLCIAFPRDFLGRPSHFADIEIYKPRLGMPYATCLYRIDFEKISSHQRP